jgi:hypothetical protein
VTMVVGFLRSLGCPKRTSFLPSVEDFFILQNWIYAGVTANFIPLDKFPPSACPAPYVTTSPNHPLCGVYFIFLFFYFR